MKKRTATSEGEPASERGFLPERDRKSGALRGFFAEISLDSIVSDHVC